MLHYLKLPTSCKVLSMMSYSDLLNKYGQFLGHAVCNDCRDGYPGCNPEQAEPTPGTRYTGHQTHGDQVIPSSFLQCCGSGCCNFMSLSIRIVTLKISRSTFHNTAELRKFSSQLDIFFSLSIFKLKIVTSALASFAIF